VTEVNVSPDLKNAKVFIMPLGGENKIEVLESLNRIKGYIQKLISSEIQLRQIPRLSFVIDTTFEYANKIDNIIKNINKND
jgi:ribosome-binding factor A